MCDAIEEYVIPFFDRTKTLADLQNHYGGEASDYRSVSIQATIHVLNGKPLAAIEILCQWRGRYTEGTAKRQLECRADVTKFAQKLGLELPPDNYVPASVQDQLCSRFKEECQQLTQGIGSFHRVKNTYGEILLHGPVPVETKQLYRAAQHVHWPTLSSRQLCRMAKKMCNMAAKNSNKESNEMYRDAHLIFSIVSEREGVPEAYGKFAKIAAENANDK